MDRQLQKWKGSLDNVMMLSLLLATVVSSIEFATGIGPSEKSRKSMSEDRVSKLLPIFQVVRFPNDPCVGSTNNGTCYTSEECSNRGGTDEGSCASGFGVCCTFTYGCGTMSSENCTYFTNTNPVAGACSYKVCPTSNDICSIRLDFSTFVLTGPTTVSTAVVERLNGLVLPVAGAGKDSAEAGRCLTDTFTVSNQVTLPMLCGTNTGDHVYFDADDDCNSLDFNLGQAATGTTLATRSWTVKVTQVSCNDKNRPPSGCDQYYFGATMGIFTTFNYQSGSGRHLANQHQTICFRKEQGMCRICFSADAVIDVSYGSTDAQGAIGFVGGSECCGYTSKGGAEAIATKLGGYDCIMIPGALDKDNAIKAASQCANNVGIITADAGDATGTKTVCSKQVPFRLNFLTDGYEWVGSTESANTDQEGFKLRYFLTAC